MSRATLITANMILFLLCCKRMLKNFKLILVFTVISVLTLFTYVVNFNPNVIAIDNGECRALDPWDKSLRSFLVKSDTPSCYKSTDSEHLVFVDSKGNLQFNKSLASIKQLDIEDLTCTLQRIKRGLGDSNVTFGEEILVQVYTHVPLHVKSQVFRIKCLRQNDLVYDMVQLNPFHCDIGKCKPTNETQNEALDKLSVIIVALDSVSRSHARRNLQASYPILKDKFQCYDFKTYNRAGENTWPNVLPLLTGQSFKQLNNFSGNSTFFDTMPLLWNDPALNRVATFYAENEDFLSTFNLVRKGFDKPPTDYYFRPFELAAKKVKPFFHTYLDSTEHCYGKMPYLDLQFDLLKSFLRRYSGKRKFAFMFNNDLSHDSFNTLHLGDKPLTRFLTWLQETHLVDRSILLFLSDHGFRIGGASETLAGRRERNNPWFMVHVPKAVLNKHPWIHQNLQSNTEHLASHYDTYQTIHDIFYNVSFNKVSIQYPETNSLVKRNIFSLFPVARTCTDAGIPSAYCTCGKQVSLSTSSSLASMFASQIVSGINTYFTNHSNVCMNLTVHNITEFKVIYFLNSSKHAIDLVADASEAPYPINVGLDSTDERTGRYTIVYFTYPGFARFESILDIVWTNESENKLSVFTAEPSRLNKYGNQSHCVQEAFLKMYCFCADDVPET